MLSKSIYINGLAGCFPSAGDGGDALLLHAEEPGYKEYLDATSARRLSRLLKMALVCSKQALAQAGDPLPDGVVTGTGLGCIEDTEKFLNTLLDNELGMLSPTSFIQSTHNTISGQIALMLKCHSYNNTWAHRWLSFEQAMDDALLLLEEGHHHVLVGSADDLTPRVHEILQELALYRSDVQDTKTPLAGESVCYFVVSTTRNDQTKARVAGLKMFDHSVDPAAEAIRFVAECGVDVSEVDAVIFGNNGDSFDYLYEEVRGRFPLAGHFIWKDRVGESFTSVAYAWKMACGLVQPAYTANKTEVDTGHKLYHNVLIYNQFRNRQHSFSLLQRA